MGKLVILRWDYNVVEVSVVNGSGARGAQAAERERAYDHRTGDVFRHASVAQVVLVQAITGQQIPLFRPLDELHGLEPAHQQHVLG